MTIGIDYSMTCPAACLYTPTVCQFWYAHESKRPALDAVTCDPIPAGLSVSRRAALLARHLTSWVVGVAPDLQSVAIEDYAFAATGRVFHIGENTGILKYFLDEMDLDIRAIPPTVIKKFATGKGNAKKDQMTCAFLNTYPAARSWITAFFPRYKEGSSPAKSPLADLADAYWIARYDYETVLDNRVAF
jgi:Holliday junction resolvasome RuvABC endonuclease subunit